MSGPSATLSPSSAAPASPAEAASPNSWAAAENEPVVADPLAHFGLREVRYPITAPAGSLTYSVLDSTTRRQVHVTRDFRRSGPTRLALVKRSPSVTDCGLTILRCAPGRRAAKLIVVDPQSCTADPATWRYEVQDYDCGALFTSLVEIEVSNIHELYFWLRTVAMDPSHLLIRGQPLPNAEPPILRRGEGSKEHAAFRNALRGRRWVMIDVDHELTGTFDLVRAPEAAVRAVIAHLPVYLQRATCVWQLSSTAWLRGVRVHLFYWLSRHATDQELTYALADYPVDRSVFRCVQPHFVADPIFEGVSDPLPRRWGLLSGGQP